MATYKYDTHVHTSEVSPCGKVNALELVKLYKAAGYDGLVVTDHYCDEYFYSLDGLSWEEKIDMYLSGYRTALAEGQRIGLEVILGIELRFSENENDYLVYGIDESFLKKYKELYKLGIKRFRKMTSGMDILIYQAHPFRSWIEPVDPALLDGVEVFNGNPRQDNMNHKALSFAKKHNLKMISGSDFHRKEDLARGGIIIPRKVKTSAELVQLLRNDEVLGLIEPDSVS
ncbi:MAG TPA: PHP domain-containing protein [Clostridiaceae bacterium]|nr:PHP domain-containing protein [Clostridiaceae bacterium]